MSASIERGISLLIEALRARVEGRSCEAGAREFWALAQTVGPDLFVTSVRDTFAERIAVALARDSGGDVDALRVEARAAIARDMLRCFALRSGAQMQ
jgi:hypothetical protein